MSERIEKQRKIAGRIVSELKQLGISSVVAGGAPRDWFFGATAKDIDIFVQTESSSSSKTELFIDKICQEKNWALFSKIFESYGDLRANFSHEISDDALEKYNNRQKISFGNKEFTDSKFIVSTFYLEDEEIQLIFRDFSSPEKLVETFECSISEVYLDEQIVCTERFYETLRTGIVKFSKHSAYTQKIAEKFCQGWKMQCSYEKCNVCNR